MVTGATAAGPDVVGARIDALLAELEDAGGPDVGGRADELVRLLVGLYGQALRRVIELAGPAAAARMGDDDLVGPMLVIHGLHPLAAAERVRRALRGIRAGPGREAPVLVGIDDDGVAHVSVGGGGCSGVLNAAVEEAVMAAAPELAGVAFDAVTSPAAFIPLGAVGRRRRAGVAPAAGG